jgi:signal transduction histidine kinase
MTIGGKPIRTEVPGAIDDRKIALIRLILAVVTLLVLRAMPSWTAVSLDRATAGNIVYAALIYVAALRRKAFSKAFVQLLTLLDVSVYTFLLWQAGGSNAAITLSLAYAFTIFVACTRFGAVRGFMTAAACATLYLGAIYTQAQPFVWSQDLLPAVYLLVLGFMLSYRSRAASRFSRRLALLNELSLTANPRLGVDRTAGLFIQRVLAFFEGDTCVFAQFDPDAGQYQLRTATRRTPQGGIQASAASSAANEILPILPRSGVAVFKDHAWRKGSSYRVGDPISGAVTELPYAEAGLIARWLKARSFAAVPLRRHEIFRGYLCIGASRTGAFKMEDGLFLQQVADQMTPVLEHIRLVDRLASDAADDERRRLARSIHDRVIQPYLGLQIGLKALHQMFRANGHPAIAALESLITMTRDGVADLRQYVYGLRRSSGGKGVLADSILRYASKFEAATGVHVTIIDRIGQLDIQDRLAADLFQMAAEALSNVHRHTAATAVTLILEEGEAGTVVLHVENEAQAQAREFTPDSISDRADALGGRTQVDRQPGRTVVRVEIPL